MPDTVKYQILVSVDGGIIRFKIVLNPLSTNISTMSFKIVCGWPAKTSKYWKVNGRLTI